MIAYFLKTIVCSALLLAFYLVFLEKEKMHRFKRIYLLFSLVFPLAVPFFTITMPAEVAPIPLLQPEQFIAVTTAENTLPVSASSVAPPTFNYLPLLWALYGTVALLLLCRFCIQFGKLFINLRGKEKIRYSGSVLVLTHEPVATHSFLNYIFISKEDYSKRYELAGLLSHELAHVRQCHSWDVVLMELLQAIWWFNPLLPFYRKAIRLNHEFLADEAALKQETDVAGYQHMLLNTIQKENRLRLSSSINFLLTKKRLVMMTKKTRRFTACVKLVASALILAGIVVLFSDKSFAQDSNNERKGSLQKTPANKAVSQGTLPATEEGVSAETMAEYARIRNKALIPGRKGTMTYSFNKYSTADKEFMGKAFLGMNQIQRDTAVLHFTKHHPPIPKTIITEEKFEALKNPAVYGIWIDDKRVANKALDKYKASDFSNLGISKLYGAAKKGRSYTHQVNLSTNAYYEDYYKKASADTSYWITVIPKKTN